MPHAPLFDWHPLARLFVADTPVPRPDRDTTAPGLCLPEAPGMAAAQALAARFGRAPFLAAPADVARAIALPDRLPQDSFATLTGGSTGTPKVIGRRQSSWTASFAENARTFAYAPGRDRLAVLGGLGHSLALYGALEGLQEGLAVHLLGGLPAARQRALCAALGVSVLYATPTQLRLLAGAGPGAEASPGGHGDASGLPALRLILCGGGALDAATQAAVTALAPAADVRVFYGAAETSFVTMAAPDTPLGCVGRPYPGVELEIRDAEGEPGAEIGEVWLRSPYLFSRYLAGASDSTRRCGDFVTVGEWGRRDGQGRLWLLGRGDRRVQIADQMVFPERVEAALAPLLGGADVVVLDRPDPLRGRRLVAVVEGAPDAALGLRLRQEARDRLGALSTPQEVHFHASLPRLASGKPDLQALRCWIADGPGPAPAAKAGVQP